MSYEERLRKQLGKMPTPKTFEELLAQGKKKKVKFNNKKSDGFDSEIERKIFSTILQPLERSRQIKDLSRLDRHKDYVLLQDGFTIVKNGKKSKQRSIKFTPDFYFYNVNSIFFPSLKREVKVYLELKSEITKKEASYNIRKRLFLKMLKSDECFIEAVSKRGRFEYEVYFKEGL